MRRGGVHVCFPHIFACSHTYCLACIARNETRVEETTNTVAALAIANAMETSKSSITGSLLRIRILASSPEGKVHRLSQHPCPQAWVPTLNAAAKLSSMGTHESQATAAQISQDQSLSFRLTCQVCVTNVCIWSCLEATHNSRKPGLASRSKLPPQEGYLAAQE